MLSPRFAGLQFANLFFPSPLLNQFANVAVATEYRSTFSRMTR